MVMIQSVSFAERSRMRRRLAWHAWQAVKGLAVLCAGTWEGIQAAKQLEQQGVATHIILVYRYLLFPFGLQNYLLSAAI